MNKELFELADLIAKFLQEKTSEEEESKMFSLLRKEEYKDLLQHYKGGEKIQEKLDFMDRLNIEEAWRKVSESKGSNFIDRLFKFKYAAVLLFGLFFLGYWFYIGNEPSREDRDSNNRLVIDSKDHVSLTLSSGKKISLSAETVRITDGEEVLIVANNQQIIYKELVNDSKKRLKQHIAVPAGKTIKVKFSDGTNAWLNAQSSVSFLANFDEQQRKVSLKGEGFFEVQHEASRPFIVDTEQSSVKVLGTKFNVKSFKGKATTVLLEGKVELSQNQEKVILKPGEGAEADGFKLKKEAVDVAGAVAWKNGLFLFEKAALSEVLDEISRWYGVRLNGNVDELNDRKFSGKIKRNTSLDEMLLIINDVSGVSLSYENDMIKVNQ
ncbi:FecR domain-containing protein [Echinicola marina]|uniref:FecR family protein n=1 Tax=Echinicola marina TaxID=2859768 RepID=UPI001CF6A05F|nr:FecR domain-containing protein [Echinicola marina]UCS91873.1 FecR domain-containing protein [Echinicola marina]